MMTSQITSLKVDVERFRLRRFVESLVEAGECDVVEKPIDLINVAAQLDGNRNAVWLRNVAGSELVGNVMGSRKRLARALGTTEADISGEMQSRLEKLISPTEIDAADAPVQQVVRTGAEVSFLDLPVHLQHTLDGAPYISAGIDFAVDPKTGWTNAGCRRIMLRSSTSAGIDLNAPSDLRVLYADYAARGEALPVAYAVGSHPVDFLGAMAATPPCDELAVLGALRQVAVPVVKCVTNDIRVPADAEFIIEGYFDTRGLVEPEGPYGEYIGYYGVMKRNPVFHLTAITSRRDALFQTVTIGGRWLARTDTAQLGSIKTEATIWAIMPHAVREPVAIYAPPSTGGMYNVRVSLKQRYPGEARNALAAVFASTADVKHAFVVDADIDVFDAEQMDWALATRFQADRDLLLGTGFRAVPLDPSLAGSRVGAKAGFDLTLPFGKASSLEYTIPEPPVWEDTPKRSVIEALRDGPCTFLELMQALGTRDGREVVEALGALYESHTLKRTDDGLYSINNDPS